MDKPVQVKRRELLRQAATGGAAAAGSLAIAAPMPVAAADAPSGRKIKAGIIGCGIASNVYLPNSFSRPPSPAPRPPPPLRLDRPPQGPVQPELRLVVIGHGP